jgi:preprotein translocase subunit SecD
VYQADVSSVATDQIDEALAGVRDVIERRVNSFGVSEPVVQTNRVGDNYRVIVELAGVHDPGEAIRLIGETPQLDFRTEVALGPELPPGQLKQEDFLNLAFARTQLTGKHLKRATVAFDPVTGAPQVDLEFDSEGATLFAELTRNNLNKRIAIFLDGVPISIPVVQTEITTGQAVISGGFKLDEAKALAERLTAGALPIPVTLVSQQTVGPSLGQREIQKSMVAGGIGIVILFVWIITFYRVPGLVAAAALSLYTVYLLALIKLIPITLTLAGIAGLVMSIGMAVDANVLIFERFRENMRSGKNVRYSLEDGFKGAWSSIRDSNVSSLLIAAILYVFGTSIIRGFALTLALGIMLSMFTAIVFTRTLMFLIIPYAFWHKPKLLAVRTVPSPPQKL